MMGETVSLFPWSVFHFLAGTFPWLLPVEFAFHGLFVSSVSDFNERNLCLTEKLLHRGYRCHKLHKTFSKFYYRYTELLRKFGCACRTLIRQGISRPAFYGNIVYKAHKFKKCPSNLTDHLNRLIHKGYKFNIVVKSLSLVFMGRNIDPLIIIIIIFI